MADMATTREVTIVPANEAGWEDLQAVLGRRGDPSRCSCQRYKMQPRESWASLGAEELAFRLRTQKLALPFGPPQGRPAAKDDEPFLVGVMEVVRPELLPGIDLVHAPADELGA
ncbi:MAG: hypothetical protein H0V15_00570, partial [Solirubrobacterales bacterium]|nr:hypothetical protein [Solirubrobacterales bacterium]